MDIFNKAKESLTAATKGISQKATDVSGLAKVTLKIKEEEKQLENTLQELGSQLYNTRNPECRLLFPELANTLEKLYADLEKNRIELAFYKGNKICPNCGAELTSDLQRCTECGMNVEHVERPVQAPPQCQKCGAPLIEGSKFCNNCGEKIE